MMMPMMMPMMMINERVWEDRNLDKTMKEDEQTHFLDEKAGEERRTWRNFLDAIAEQANLQSRTVRWENPVKNHLLRRKGFVNRRKEGLRSEMAG